MFLTIKNVVTIIPVSGKLYDADDWIPLGRLLFLNIIIVGEV